MSLTKRYLESLSEKAGFGGELTEEFLDQQRAIDEIDRQYEEQHSDLVEDDSVKECEGCHNTFVNELGDTYCGRCASLLNEGELPREDPDSNSGCI